MVVFANAKEFIHKFILNDIENKELFYDSKTSLQEIVQGQYEEDVHYVLVREEGPDHNKSFYVEAMLGSRGVLGEGLRPYQKGGGAAGSLLCHQKTEK